MQELRLRIAKHAHNHSIKSAARVFQCSRNTVRKWYRLYLFYQEQGITTKKDMHLEDVKRITTNHPNAMNTNTQQRLYRILETRYNNRQRIIITHIVKNHHIPYSVDTVRKYAKRWGFFIARHNKSKQKRYLVEVKKKMRFCEVVQVDIKYLTDIPELYPSLHTYKQYGFPSYQITARDVATGTLWYAYAQEKSTANTKLFIEYLGEHLKRYGLNMTQTIFQTDGGTEFTNQYLSVHPKPTAFQCAITDMGAIHRVNPAASPTYNSDVESSHRLIEDEAYSNQWKVDTAEFLSAMRSYQSYFNLERYNTYKKGTPRDLLEAKHIPVDNAVLVLRPIIVDTLLLHSHRLKEVA